ncbi:hypothetical protein GQ602_003989 [Ophiocordyceps camponoti-floridani]|uniref:Major facilitator superfamily (MFS) profile domain-containing protein n=1 Tax=Ophiocordyceps camponoti-floridani TaxID=2030778 RepID=A0A8H4Q6E8_9HYPO|nr:hypothetical protein GQ602_003989 [Ophiocordyceps camponoti-floridani]
MAAVVNSRTASPSFARTGGELDFDSASESEIEIPSHDAIYTPQQEKQVLDLLDRKLVLFIGLLYMLSFLDRSNIGNARIAGMEADLQTSPPLSTWYDWCLTSFYATYMASAWLALIWRLVPAHVLVTVVVLAWGVAASVQAVVPSYPYLVALRALLAVGEAGFTGVPLYLSWFYKREELALRTGYFISAAPLASSFASALAWLILRFASLSPIAPWRLLFLAEGIPSVLASVSAWTRIPDSARKAPFLTARQRRIAHLRLPPDTPPPTRQTNVLVDPIAWTAATMLLLANMAYASLPVFLPLLVEDMGHGPVAAQALSAPPFLVSFIAVLVTARFSDRIRDRTAPLVAHAVASAGGYALLAAAPLIHLPPLLRYLALFPAAAGFFCVVTLIITWNINNQPGRHRQGLAFALMQFVGQCGPLIGTRLYPARHAPFYTPGMLVCACAMGVVAVLGLVLRRLLRSHNRNMDRADDEKLTEERERLVGEGETMASTASKSGSTTDTTARFRYML